MEQKHFLGHLDDLSNMTSMKSTFGKTRYWQSFIICHLNAIMIDCHTKKEAPKKFIKIIQKISVTSLDWMITQQLMCSYHNNATFWKKMRSKFVKWIDFFSQKWLAFFKSETLKASNFLRSLSLFSWETIFNWCQKYLTDKILSSKNSFL